jgi:hypothetical protein
MTDLTAPDRGVDADVQRPATHLVVRVWLPDRPGALGQVASRIGALSGDVVGIDILERDGGRAVDELVVALPASFAGASGQRVDVVALLASEIAQVDGVAVEDVRVVDAGRTDPGLAALEASARLAELPSAERAGALVDVLTALFDTTWVALLELDGSAPPITTGTPPDLSWVSAFVGGSLHLADGASDRAPADLAWALLPRNGEDVERARVIVAGRDSRPFHRRERQQVGLLSRIAATS